MTFIHWWYGWDKALEEIEELLELALLGRANLLLIKSFITMSMFTLNGILVIIEFKKVTEGERKYLFATSLIVVTMQDGDKRERSDNIMILYSSLLLN